MQLQENVSLRSYHTFGIDVYARRFAAFDSVERLEALTGSLDEAPLILGGGSNLLFTRDVEGTVLRNEIGGIEIVGEEGDAVFVKAGAGVEWHAFVRFCLEQQLAGVENLSLIPGSVGASPMQNIGAYGVEIKDVFHELEAFHLQDRTVVRFGLADCAFGYRESVFKRQYKGQFVILNVTFRLSRKPVFQISYGAIRQELVRMGVTDMSIQAVSQAVINIRTSKLPDPKLVGNAGSFFKNPQVPNEQFEVLKSSFPDIVAFPVSDSHTKLAAGWLIEQCGWKGFREGDAGCYPKQALVLVNYGNARGAEIYDLSERIIGTIQEKFGVTLEREVNIY